MWGCFTNVSQRVLEIILSKFVYCRNRNSYEKISSWMFVSVPKAMLWSHVQSFNLKFAKCKLWHCIFREITLESSRNVSESTPWKISTKTQNKIAPSKRRLGCASAMLLFLRIGFRSGFSRREISNVYLWCWWQWIEQRNSMRKIWLKA